MSAGYLAADPLNLPGGDSERGEVEVADQGVDGYPIKLGLDLDVTQVALEVATGKLIWSVDLVDKYQAIKPHYGFSTSPLMMDGVLIVPIGAKDGAIAGLDPASGKLLWKCGEDWLDTEAADAFHADPATPWKLTGEHFVMVTTCAWSYADAARWHADRTHQELVEPL